MVIVLVIAMTPVPMPPPGPVEELFEMVVLRIEAVPPPCQIAPPKLDSLESKVEPSTVSVPPI